MKEPLNKKMEPTPKEKVILYTFAKDGPLSPWDLSDKGRKKVASYKTVNEGCHHLTSLGLVELKKRPPDTKGRKKRVSEDPHKGLTYVMGRKKDYYGLTFHGVLYALNINAFSEQEAANVRFRNFAEVPLKIKPPTLVLRPEVQEFLPRTVRLEMERVTLMLETLLRPEKQAYDTSIRKIASEARRNKTDIRLFSFIEQKYSKRIYEALRRVNPTPRHYDENYALMVFNEEMSDCFNESFLQLLSGDKKAFQEMAEVLKDDYSVDVLQKGLFRYWSRLHETLLKAEPHSDPKLLEVWRALSEWSSKMSKAKREDVRNLLLTSGPKAILSMKKHMSES